MKTLLSTIGLSLVSSPALAAATRTDGSGIVMWVFLGFCGLIVALQLIPSILMMFGMAKGLSQKTEVQTETTK